MTLVLRALKAAVTALVFLLFGAGTTLNWLSAHAAVLQNVLSDEIKRREALA